MEDDEIEEETEKPADIKLAEFRLKESSVLVIKKTTYKGEDRIDFRVWLDSPKYKGPTKQGFVLTMDKIDDFIKAIEGMKGKLSEVKKKKK
jgi:hypothetical protein